MLGAGYSDTNNTVASALRRLGYTTGMVGKWHLTKPDEASFQDPYPKQTAFVKQSGFDFVDALYINNMCECDYPVCLTFTHNMEWLLDRALHFMDGAMLKQLPFFLYFAPTVPHRPTVEDALLGRYSPDATPAGTLARLPDISRYCSSCVLPSRKHIWDSVAGLSSTSRVRSCWASLASLRWIDEALGVLYDFLSERSALGNTYIVISTDHGSGKMTLYELGIRVPLYVVGPGIRAGTRVDEPVSHVDLAPTFLRWAGCGGSVDSCMAISVDGLSWSSLASTGAGSLDREGVRAESFFDRALVTRGFMKFYTSPTTAIVSNRDGPPIVAERAKDLAGLVGDSYPALYEEFQLYNLTADPMEQVNLWHS
jgi:arylsulfatase A-like enzyme